MHAEYVRPEDDSPEGLQDFPSDLNVQGVLDLHYNGFPEVTQNGREGKVLHDVHIKLEDGSSEGLQDFPSDFNAPRIVNMHCNDVRKVTWNSREGKALHAVHARSRHALQ